MPFEEELELIQGDIARLIERLDDLVYDSIRAQLHGDDARSTEKRLSRARNALRRAESLLRPAGDGEFEDP